MEYMGKVNVTSSGHNCISWSEVGYEELGRGHPYVFPDESIHNISNWCRNPTADPGGPWCYYSGEDWDYCDIPYCGKIFVFGKMPDDITTIFCIRMHICFVKKTLLLLCKCYLLK